MVYQRRPVSNVTDLSTACRELASMQTLLGTAVSERLLGLDVQSLHHGLCMLDLPSDHLGVLGRSACANKGRTSFFQLGTNGGLRQYRIQGLLNLHNDRSRCAGGDGQTSKR